MKNQLVFIPLLTALLLGACTPKSDQHASKDRLEQAYRIMDKGDYDEAISQLEELSKEDTRPEVREALASAYAARAGIKIENYWGFLAGFQSPKVSNEQVQNTTTVVRIAKVLNSANSSQKKTDSDGQDTITKMAQMFGALQLWQDRLNSLPAVRGGARKDLERAWSVMKDHEKSGGHLYRALLGLVLLKSDLTSGFDGWNKIELKLKDYDPAKGGNLTLQCTADLNAFGDWSLGVLVRLGDTVEDISIAFPSKRPELAGAMKESRRFTREFQRIQKGACE